MKAQNVDFLPFFKCYLQLARKIENYLKLAWHDVIEMLFQRNFGDEEDMKN